jgi:hypothetical protein
MRRGRKIKSLKNTLKIWQFLVFASVSLIPHLLYTAGVDFAGMYSVYICFPAGMGFFAFAQLYLVFSFFGWASPSTYLSAVFFSLLWTRTLQWVESIDRFAVVIFYILALFLVCWGTLTEVMSPY